MSTGTTRVELAMKRFLSQNRLSTNFMDYLRAEYLDLGSRIFPVSGLFTFPCDFTVTWASDHFTVTPNPVEGIDNAGHVLRLADAAHRENIHFANGAGVYYWVGMKYCEIVSGVYANPRTGIPEYDLNQNEVGEKDEPTSITNNLDGTLTIVVNSIFQSGYSHAGRSVQVWLKNPVTIDETVAIETRTVSYSAPNNRIVTASLLGQTTVSTDPTDYYVACIGPTVHGQVAASPMPFTDEYVVLGYIVGGNPGSYSVDDEVDLSGGGGHTLQKAYDGLSGDGSGRTVTVADQAIELRQENTAAREKDIVNSVLRIRKDIPTTLHGSGFLDEGGIDIATRFEAAHSIMVRCAIHDMKGNDELRVEEDANITDTNKLTFTRGGVDLTLASSTDSDIRTAVDLVEITGSALGQDGVYAISAVAATILTCYEYNTASTSPSWTNETGLKARIFRPVIRMNPSSYALAIRPLSDFYQDYNADASMTYGQIGIIYPSSANDDDVAIKVSKAATSKFSLAANGDIVTAGDVELSSDTAVLSFTAAMTHSDAIDMNSRSINCDEGYIANVGLLSMLSLGGGGDGIDMNGTDVTACGDVEYQTAKNYTLHVSASDAMFMDSNWDYHPGDPPGGTDCFSWLQGAGSGVEWFAIIPIHLPEGATITEIRYKVYDDVVGGDCVYCSLTRYSFRMSTSDKPNNRVLVTGATEKGSASTGWQTLTDNLAPDHAIDGEYHYELFIRITTGSADLRFAAAEIDYSVSTINAGPN